MAADDIRITPFHANSSMDMDAKGSEPGGSVFSGEAASLTPNRRRVLSARELRRRFSSSAKAPSRRRRQRGDDGGAPNAAEGRQRGLAREAPREDSDAAAGGEGAGTVENGRHGGIASATATLPTQPTPFRSVPARGSDIRRAKSWRRRLSNALVSVAPNVGDHFTLGMSEEEHEVLVAAYAHAAGTVCLAFVVPLMAVFQPLQHFEGGNSTTGRPSMGLVFTLLARIVTAVAMSIAAVLRSGRYDIEVGLPSDFSPRIGPRKLDWPVWWVLKWLCDFLAAGACVAMAAVTLFDCVRAFHPATDRLGAALDSAVGNPDAVNTGFSVQVIIHMVAITVNSLPWLRLLSLLRLPSSVGAISHLTQAFLMPRLLSMLFWLFLLLHSIACAWVGLGRAEGFGTSPFLPREDLASVSPFLLYAHALHWALAGCDGAEPTTTAQLLFHTTAVVLKELGALFLVGNAAALVSERDRDQANFVRRVEEVMAYVDSAGVPAHLRHQVQRYYKYRHHQQHGLTNEAEVLSDLNNRLRVEITSAIHGPTVRRVPIFDGCSAPFVAALCEILTPVSYLPGQHIVVAGEIGREMFILLHGYANVVSPGGTQLKRLGPNNFFGEVGLMFPVRRTASVVAETYCDAFIMHYHDLHGILEEYPEDMDRVTSVAIKNLQTFTDIRHLKLDRKGLKKTFSGLSTTSLDSSSNEGDDHADTTEGLRPLSPSDIPETVEELERAKGKPPAERTTSERQLVARSRWGLAGKRTMAQVAAAHGPSIVDVAAMASVRQQVEVGSIPSGWARETVERASRKADDRSIGEAPRGGSHQRGAAGTSHHVPVPRWLSPERPPARAQANRGAAQSNSAPPKRRQRHGGARPAAGQPARGSIVAALAASPVYRGGRAGGSAAPTSPTPTLESPLPTGSRLVLASVAVAQASARKDHDKRSSGSPADSPG